MSVGGFYREDMGLVWIFVRVIGAIPGLRKCIRIRIGGKVA